MARTAPKASSFLVSDATWSHIEPLIPKRKNTHRFGGGRPRRPDRDCMNGILFVLRTGCQWRALDVTGICPGSTAHDRFQEWVRVGVFWQLWCAGLMAYDELKGIDWTWLSADGAMTKAPLAGGKNRAQSHGSGQVRHQAKPAHRWPGRRDRTGRGGRERE